MDLSSRSMDELKALEQQVAGEIKSRHASEIANARAQILAIAESAGLSKDDLRHMAGKKGASPRAQGVQIYQDQDNPANRWGGRGPHPAWLKAALGAGKTLADFAVRTSG